jgi:hypothetical protein
MSKGTKNEDMSLTNTDTSNIEALRNEAEAAVAEAVARQEKVEADQLKKARAGFKKSVNVTPIPGSGQE